MVPACSHLLPTLLPGGIPSPGDKVGPELLRRSVKAWRMFGSSRTGSPVGHGTTVTCTLAVFCAPSTVAITDTVPDWDIYRSTSSRPS